MAYIPRATADIYGDDTNKPMISSEGSKATPTSSPVPTEYTMLCNAMIKAPFTLASGGLVPARRSLVAGPLYAGSSGPVVPPIFGAYW